MKTNLFLFSLFFSFFLIGCDGEEYPGPTRMPEGSLGSDSTSNAGIPEGYFKVRFFTSASDPNTRGTVTGQDGRVQHIRYIIYKQTGEYVKEKVVLMPAQGTPTWPLDVINEILPKGQYRVVFLGNVQKELFPYTTDGSNQLYSEVLTSYQSNYSDARIILPPVEFSGNTEYYWANTMFSDASPNAQITLQRIIGMARLHRNFVDANGALSKLVLNIKNNVDYGNLIRSALLGTLPDYSDGILYNLLKPLILRDLVGATTAVVDALLNELIKELVGPITNALYATILQPLTTQVEAALAANSTSNEDWLAFLGRILNPWAYGTDAIVTIDNFPRTTDFSLAVKEYFPSGQKFKYHLKEDNVGEVNERYVAIKGFNDVYNVKKIDILARGLIAGLVVDQIIDSNLLLSGVFMDITDPISVTGPKNNFRYKADYSFLDLYLKSYSLPTDGPKPLSLSVQIGSIANIDGVLSNVFNTLTELPLLGPAFSLLGSVITGVLFYDIKQLTVTVPLNIPLLGVDNLALRGGWSSATQY